MHSYTQWETWNHSKIFKNSISTESFKYIWNLMKGQIIFHYFESKMVWMGQFKKTLRPKRRTLYYFGDFIDKKGRI